MGDELDSTAAFTREAVGINFMAGLLQRKIFQIPVYIRYAVSVTGSVVIMCFIFWRSQVRFSTQKSTNLRFQWVFLLPQHVDGG